jgi:hypothetical protein
MGEDLQKPVLDYRSPDPVSSKRSVALAVFSICFPIFLLGAVALHSGVSPESRNPFALISAYLVSVGSGTALFGLHRRSWRLLPLLIFSLGQAACLLLVGWLMFRIGHWVDIDLG